MCSPWHMCRDIDIDSLYVILELQFLMFLCSGWEQRLFGLVIFVIELVILAVEKNILHFLPFMLFFIH